MEFGLFSGARTVVGERPSDKRLYDDYVDYYVEADRLGYRSVFLVEHHFSGFGQVSASLTFLSHIAARTKRLRLGTAVTVLPWYNPALLVEQAAMVDLLSGGRLDLGVGRGYRAAEFDGFAMTLAEGGERYAETLAFLKQAWTAEGRFSFAGKFWSYDDIALEPAPLQRPHPPLWMGAASPDSLKRAAREGVNVLLAQHGTPKEMAEKAAIYREAVEASGRTFDPLSVGLTRAFHLVETAAERDAAHAARTLFMRRVQDLTHSWKKPQTGSTFLRKWGSDAEVRAQTEAEALIGSSSELVERVEEYRSLGLHYLLLMDVTGSLAGLRTFAEKVMPRFAAPAQAERATAAE